MLSTGCVTGPLLLLLLLQKHIVAQAQQQLGVLRDSRRDALPDVVRARAALPTDSPPARQEVARLAGELATVQAALFDACVFAMANAVSCSSC